jgi:hypothetical protein
MRSALLTNIPRLKGRETNKSKKNDENEREVFYAQNNYEYLAENGWDVRAYYYEEGMPVLWQVRGW